jgi:carbon starvation protein
MVVVLAVLVFGIRTALAAQSSAKPTANESPMVPMPAVQ